MPAIPAAQDKRALRRQMRQRRRALTPLQQHRASVGLCRVLGGSLLFRKARRIAFYLARDGEIDPGPLLALAARLGKRCYLPVVAGQRMWFGEYHPGDRLYPNRFGIPEPRLPRGGHFPAARLDLVLTPLVAFDRRGGRLGMGGGFYDRSFAFKRRQPGRPALVGLAHHFQEVASLPLEPWDIPLVAIVSDIEMIRVGTWLIGSIDK